MRRPPSAPRPRPFPLLPLAAAVLIVLGCGQLGYWAWQANQPAAVKAPEGNPFNALVGLQQRHAEARAVAERAPRRVSPPPGAPLAVGGVPDSAVTVVLLTDPSSAQSRRQVSQWRAAVGQQARLELYYAPMPSSTYGSGMVLELARKSGTLPQLWEALERQPTDLTETEMLELLAQTGVPLTTLRQNLSGTAPATLQSLAPMLTWLKTHALRAPMALVDGFVVEGNPLRPELLDVYVMRRQRAEALIQTEDYLLMRR